MTATLALSKQTRQPDRVGKLVGEVSIELQTGDAVSLFNGRTSGDTRHFSAGLEHYSARTMLVKRFALVDPLAAEILVDTENRFNQLHADLLETQTSLQTKFENFGSALQVESYSSRPVKKSCSGFNPYGMRAVRMLLELDKIILGFRRATHVTLLTKPESSKAVELLCRRFRGILYPAFQYRPHLTREDFDSHTDRAAEFLRHYRRILYIRQNDTRTDEQLCQHYATYDGTPAYG